MNLDNSDVITLGLSIFKIYSILKEDMVFSVL